jgi:nitrite reductase (NO-forming)
MNFAAMNLNRRTLLAGIGTTAAVGAVIGEVGAAAAKPTPVAPVTEPVADPATLPRVKVDLVAPPLVHEHDQVAVGGPKIV